MSHHMNTCVQCRDWGHLERHEDHWPPRSEAVLSCVCGATEATGCPAIANPEDCAAGGAA